MYGKSVRMSKLRVLDLNFAKLHVDKKSSGQHGY